MTIDIDGLSEAELIDLNHRIVERLRLLQQMRAHKQMLEFRIGDRVAFQADGRGTRRRHADALQPEVGHGDHRRWAPLERGAGPPDPSRRSRCGEAAGPPEPGPPEVVPRAAWGVTRRPHPPGHRGRVPGVGARSGPPCLRRAFNLLRLHHRLDHDLASLPRENAPSSATCAGSRSCPIASAAPLATDTLPLRRIAQDHRPDQ